MKHMYYSKLFTIIISFTLLIAPLPLMAITEEIIDSLSAIEKEILINNKDKNYIYLGENLDNIKTIIAKIKILDPYKESILDNFNDHIAKGFLLISTHDLLETLQYANQVIEYNYHKSDNDELKKITNELQSLTMTVLKKDLITDQNSDNELITRKHFKTLRIKKHLHVAGKSHFNKDMHAKQDISAKGKLHIRKSGHFGQGLRVDGMLSTGDAIINSLSLENIFIASCIDSVCINNLSVNDITIEGTLSTHDIFVNGNVAINNTLSVENAIISNATIDNLDIIVSVLDSVIENLTVTEIFSASDATIENLTVTNCIAQLCVNTLSTNDLSINGVLSVNNEIITGNLHLAGFNTPGILHNDASGNITSSLIFNADISPSAAISDTKFATITSAGKVANSATTATNADSSNTIVSRDSSGDFSAGTITANLIGNATSATTAGSSSSFSGSLAGDVTGTQSATVVSSVGGQSAANVAAGTSLANNATNADVANTIVKRDASGNFAAGTITANLIGNATSATTAGSSSSFSGSLAGDVTGTQSATVVSSVGGQSAANIAAGTSLANNATNTNTVDTIVRRDASGNFSANTITAHINGNITGAASLNVLKTGDTMTGALIIPAGTATAPSIKFTGSTNTGFSAATSNTLSFDTNGVERLKIDSLGNITIDNFNTAGIIHNNNAGLLSTSLIVNADIDPSAAITDTKLATITTVGKVANSATTATNVNTINTIVARDSSGNFSTNMITITGTVNNPTDVATKNYVDIAISAGLVAKNPATAMSIVNTTLSGLQTIDGIALIDNNRVLLTGQTNQTENGLWVAHAGAWTRPADFNTGNTAGAAYVLILSGNVYGGSSWLCNTPNAIIDTDPILFSEFSLPSQITAANVGIGTGQIFRNKTGNTLNFKSLLQGTHISITNNADDITIATDATNINTPNSLVARDNAGNFIANVITANLNGNATTATTATNFSGSFAGDVTGAQNTTVVNSVGGQTATDIATGTILANAATSTNTPDTIVKRDNSGNFSASTIIANLIGNASSATNAISFSGLLTGDVTGTQSATVVSFINGQTAASVAAGTSLANNATNADTANTIVKRDGSGNFSADTITANLIGNATSATTAGTSSSFSGSLAGDVTGTQSATVVSSVGGQSAATVAAGTSLANNATNTDTANTIVKRDASGNFAAGTITANLIGNATSATTAGSSSSFSGSLAGDVTGTQSATVVSSVGGQSAANVAAGTSLANNATNTDTANTIVKRDASGNFAAGTITANLIGNASTATNAISFSGLLTGDVTGTQSATVVSFIDGQTAANIATGAILANNATSSDTANAIVKRDASGNFSAGTITANVIGNASTATNAISFSGFLAGDVTGTQGATVVSFIDGQSAANVAAGALLANSATSTNTTNTIVKRDASGNFSTSTITANLIGNVTGNVTGSSSLNVLKAGDTMTGTLIMPAGSAASPSIKFTGSTNTGFSASVANTLSFDTNGTERMTISTSDITMASKLILQNLFCNQAIQVAVPTNLSTVTASSTTSILLLKPAGTLPLSVTIQFPASPTNGQLFTIILGSALALTVINNGNGASIANGLTAFSLGIGSVAATTYLYYAPDNTWYNY